MPYGLFDYGGTIQTMGESPKMITTKAIGEENAPTPSTMTTMALGEESNLSIPAKPSMPKPKCPITLTQDGCKYRRV